MWELKLKLNKIKTENPKWCKTKNCIISCAKLVPKPRRSQAPNLKSIEL